MSQHDYDISSSDANTGVTYRAAVNAALQALASNSSGSSAPTTTYAFQFWADTTNDILKVRNAANSAWISVCTLSTGQPSYIPSAVSSTELSYLDGVTSAIQTQISSKQATLVSGTNIKTVGGISLLGSGDVAVSSFPSGTAMLFVQTSAPTGWTKSTTHDNKALRVVSGTASSGGSTAFTSVFASRTPAGSVGVNISGGGVSASSLSVAQLASHNHSGTGLDTTGNTNGTALRWLPQTQTLYYTAMYYTGSVPPNGSNSTHTHGFTTPSGSGSFTGTAMDFAVAYVDTIIATKN